MNEENTATAGAPEGDTGAFPGQTATAAPGPAPVAPRFIPFGAELHDDQQPDDREQLTADLAAHEQRLGELADEDDEDAQAERDAATSAAALAGSGIAEPFSRGKWVHRDEHGNAIATLVNFVCNRPRCLHASLDKRHAWMHAAGHVARGQ